MRRFQNGLLVWVAGVGVFDAPSFRGLGFPAVDPSHTESVLIPLQARLARKPFGIQPLKDELKFPCRLFFKMKSTMPCVQDITTYLERIIPLGIAEEWDNVGFLLGDSDRKVENAMTCLTLTEDVADEAIRKNVDSIVSHHPILFHPVQQLTSQSAQGRTLLKLASRNIAVYSPHTGYDNVAGGINDQIASKLALNAIQPLRPFSCSDNTTENRHQGAGRFGELDESVSLIEWIPILKRQLGLDRLQYVGDDSQTVIRVGVACGSAGEFLDDAYRQNCDAFVIGETNFHTCLEARQLGMTMILIGHYSSERPALETLAENLQKEFPQLSVFASEIESDPLKWS